jgi:hypothetical protein
MGQRLTGWGDVAIERDGFDTDVVDPVHTGKKWPAIASPNKKCCSRIDTLELVSSSARRREIVRCGIAQLSQKLAGEVDRGPITAHRRGQSIGE